MSSRGASKQAETEKDHYSVTVKGGLKTGALGLGGALAGAFGLHAFGPRGFRNVTLPLKAFGVTSVTTASFIIGADRASRHYELARYESKHTDIGQEGHRNVASEQAAGLIRSASGAPRQLSTREALLEWSKDHRYSVVFGAWAASMVGSFGYISLTPLSFQQKLVQARMVAQGLTVLVLIASAGLAAIPNAQGVNEEEQKLKDREDRMFAWKKGSPHEKEAREHHESVKQEINSGDSSANPPKESK